MTWMFSNSCELWSIHPLYKVLEIGMNHKGDKAAYDNPITFLNRYYQFQSKNFPGLPVAHLIIAFC